MATIPTVVVVRAILIIVTIRPVALMVIRDEIVQSEAVVGSYEVHTLVGVIRVGSGVGKKVVAAVDATHQVRNHPRIALNETANVVAKPSVPLQPSQAWESTTELISAGVPGFCNQM